MPLVTIDGTDARDFDDAIFVEEEVQGLPPGGRHRRCEPLRATPDTALNAEALHRATSVYLPDRVLPMLPERLSNGICSLKPHEDRLCMVADMQIASNRQVLAGTKLYPAGDAQRCPLHLRRRAGPCSMAARSRPWRTVESRRCRPRPSSRGSCGAMRQRARGASTSTLPETQVQLDAEAGRPERMVRQPAAGQPPPGRGVHARRE